MCTTIPNYFRTSALLLSLSFLSVGFCRAQITTTIDFTGGNANLVYDSSQNNGSSGPAVVGIDNNYALVDSASGDVGALPADMTVATSDGNSYTLGPLDADSGIRTDLARSGGLTLNITDPTAYSAVGFLASGGDGGGTVDFTLNFANSTSVTGSFNVPDAFSGSSSNSSVDTYDRVGQLPEGNDQHQYLHLYDFTTGTTTLPDSSLVSIDLTQPSGNEVAIFGISGTPEAAAAVPEPSTYSLIVLGAGLLLARSYHRRRVSARC
jgi:hypothetical protein